MKRTLRLGVAALAAALLLPGTSLVAVAAPKPSSPPVAAAPANDEPGDATPVFLGDTVTQDTSAATASDIDAALNGQCGAPAVTHSVWFAYTEEREDGGGFVVDGEGTSFDLGFMIVEGDPRDGGRVVGCGPMLSAAMTSVGTVYYVAAFTASNTPGGDLVMSVYAAPEPPTTSISIDGTGRALADGSAVVSGTYSCTNASYGELNGRLVQTVGRLKITGYFYLSDLICDGTAQPWDAVVTSDNGLFAGGKTVSVAAAFACGLLECSESGEERAVKLSRARLK